eukprot:CAMPEP_0176389318 /NCGR_PEP_ID=MMETSP0126-20121128/38275_1 /TAXON_ID=141414 ORGANISM="Strombidinopsis acuminatum, Strain SPMC142" /NCGR_SAMPLE_ID=MMETSP0126 /ASSEMBLY_ACC=CAM_ASM_000229 /LENGTH=67 /DNA_ID=CAMNT_0017758049 /DNA_START=1528 /DNA_END=1731 /DNA_ORIENTATION=+
MTWLAQGILRFDISLDTDLFNKERYYLSQTLGACKMEWSYTTRSILMNICTIVDQVTEIIMTSFQAC